MCSHCIIGQRITLSAQIKVIFSDLGEQLYISALSINSDNFVLIQIYICGNNIEALLVFVAIAGIDHFCRNGFTILYKIDYNREQIS